MAWEENSCICLHMQLITILSRIGVVNVVKAGEAFVIPNGARHSVSAAKPFKMIITMIRG